LVVDERFEITSQIRDIGESILVLSGQPFSLSRRGTVSGVEYSAFSDSGIIQQVSVDDLEVQEGVLKPEDVIVWFDYSTTVSGALVVGNLISGAYFSSVDVSYEIKGVFRNNGHFEVHGSKL
jgi:hypothetical protein